MLLFATLLLIGQTAPVAGGEEVLPLSVLPVASANPPKKSPKHDWTFDRLTEVALIDSAEPKIRFRVWSQSATQSMLNPHLVASFLGKLYTYNMTKLRLDHSYLYGDQCVDVYLCGDGSPGGEQFFGEDDVWRDQTGRRSKVNSIFVYEVDTLDDPLEACRELAHEYGHATLPPISIPGGREEWANGHLGERLYLSWLARDMKSQKVKPEQVFGATLTDLARYSSAKIVPLLQALDKRFPDRADLDRKNDTAFSAYLACAVYLERTLPADIFRRALVLNQSQTSSGFLKAVFEALDEPESPVAIAPPIAGQQVFWVPKGSGTLLNCKVLSTAGEWAKVQAKGQVFRKKQPGR